MTEPLETADLKRIKSLLPHRYPFLMIDKVVDINGYNSARGIKNVTSNEPHFQGHFPSQPIMPGVMMIEAMGQTAGVMIGVALGMEGSEVLIYFMSIENCKFRRMVLPGDVLELHVETIRGKPGGKAWKFHGKAMVGDEIAASADIAAMFVYPED
ncbi:MAG: 3-hydroxyacyl-ACP dehydratase FabZ [Pseudomonadota bacterium]